MFRIAVGVVEIAGLGKLSRLRPRCPSRLRQQRGAGPVDTMDEGQRSFHVTADGDNTALVKTRSARMPEHEGILRKRSRIEYGERQPRCTICEKRPQCAFP